MFDLQVQTLFFVKSIHFNIDYVYPWFN